MTWEDLRDIARLLEHFGAETWPKSMIDRSHSALLALRDAVEVARENDGRFALWRAVNVFQLRDVEWHNLGCCWTHAEQSAHAYYGTHPVHRQRHGDFEPMRLRLHATVALEDINWLDTVHLNVENPPEREVRLKPGAVIEVDGGLYFAVNLRRWEPIRIKKSFRARVHELDRGYGWTSLPRRKR